MRRYSAEALLLIVTLIWGGTFVLVKDAVQTVPPFAFNALRFGIAAAVTLLLFGRYLRLLSRRELGRGVWLGVLYSVGFCLQTIGLQYTTVARSSFITGSVVVLVPVAAMIVERRRMTVAQAVGVVIVAVGLWLFTDPSGGALNIGDMLTLIGAAAWAFYICYLDVYTRVSPPDGAFGLTVRLVALQFGVAFLFGVSGMAALETPAIAPTTGLVLAVLYTSLLASVVTTFVQTHYQNRVTPVRAALIFALEPVFASAIAVVAVGESLGVWEMAGGALVIAGVLAGETGDALLSALRRRRGGPVADSAVAREQTLPEVPYGDS